MPPKNFFERVHQVAALIPYGKVTSYGAIARFIGAPKSARMVGYAMKNSISAANIAAHRVVNRNGLLSGKSHFGGSHIMQQLLENEGIEVENNQVQNLKAVFWDPNETLDPQNFEA